MSKVLSDTQGETARIVAQKAANNLPQEANRPPVTALADPAGEAGRPRKRHG